MKFSCIIPYRNRDFERVKRCLDSLDQQSFQEFEILFIDYGSDPEYRENIEKLCQRYSRMRYIYSCTEGHFWNRSWALNIGFAQAKGEYAVAIDIDMIHEPAFLEKLLLHLDPHTLVNYSCYYLPENFTSYEQLPTYPKDGWRVSDESAKGIFVVPLNAVRAIRGFDEMYKIWGVEDGDLYKRFELNGGKTKRIQADEIKVFHQWHPASMSKNAVPLGWYEIMFQHSKAKTAEEAMNSKESFGRIFTIEDRPIYAAMKTGGTEKIVFSFPSAHQYAKMIHSFLKLPSGACLYIDQSFDLIDTQAKSRWATWVRLFNDFLNKRKISYRIIEQLSYERELLDFYTIRDSVFYFLHNFSEEIADYHWEAEAPHLKCWIMRK